MVKSSANTRKNGAKSSKSSKSAANVAGVVSSAVAAAVGGAGTSHETAVAVASGVASPAVVPAGRASDVSALMDNDLKVIELRSKIAAKWAAGRFEDSPEYIAVSAAVAGLDNDLRDRAINGARLAWLARPENAEKKTTLAAVCEHINQHYSKEFRQICGCAVPAAASVRVYSYSYLSVSTITADSDINDYLVSTAVPAGLSASGLVAAVMSVRVLADVKRRFAAARAAARNEFRNSMAAAARRAGRLGVPAAVAARYFNFLLSAVPAADASEEKRLRKNLASCWASLRTLENEIVLAAPAGAFGAIEDTKGGWCFPASLPASAPAKCRKLWAKRVRLLSSIDTLNGLLSRC
jgi:hypothetical protein